MSLQRFLIAIASALALTATAQRTEILASDIATVEMRCAADEGAWPVLRLGSDDTFAVHFDQFGKTYHRYVYHIEHLSPRFAAEGEDLFESEYVDAAADEEVIEDWTESSGTITPYIHYSFTFPNARMRPLLSGNYRLIVERDDERREPVLRLYFSVLEEAASVGLSLTTNTEIDWNGSHQQILLRVDLGQLPLRDAQTEVQTVVLQNRRWDTAVWNARPDYVHGNTLEWTHSRQLIFDAGNEYRSFELLSTRYPGMGVERVDWFEPCYHATLLAAAPRRNYLRTDDRNGQCVIRTTDGNDSDCEGEYVWTHFVLHMPPLPDGERLFVNGQWTHGRFLPACELHYNAAEERYEASLFLKQGYYSYQYLTLDPHTDRGSTRAVEGNYFQTENEYAVLVYYRRTGDRYWRLVGHVAASKRV